MFLYLDSEALWIIIVASYFRICIFRSSQRKGTSTLQGQFAWMSDMTCFFIQKIKFPTPETVCIWYLVQPPQGDIFLKS